MDFIDWRKSPEKVTLQETQGSANKYHGRRYRDYIEEQIREAEERGAFANLPGYGKPLQLEDNVYAGDRAMGYNLLKSNGFAPPEVELIKEIRTERERIDEKIAQLVRRRTLLRSRRLPLFSSTKRMFNHTIEQTAKEYEATLHELNRKILTLNLIVPTAMHQQLLDVEQLVQQFRSACPHL